MQFAFAFRCEFHRLCVNFTISLSNTPNTHNNTNTHRRVHIKHLLYMEISQTSCRAGAFHYKSYMYESNLSHFFLCLYQGFARQQ